MPAIPKPFSQKTVSEWIKQFQESESSEDRFQAIQAIGLLADPQEVSQIASAALGDSDASIRAIAAKFLRNSNAQISIEVENRLVALLIDSDPDVRFESARALIRHTSTHSKDVLPILTAFLDEAETHALMIAAVLNSLVELDLDQTTADNQILPRLLPLLEHDRAEVREAVSITFAKWPEISKSCIEQLLPLLDDSEPVVREKIAFTIGRAGIVNDAIRSALKAACNDEDVEVARIASEAISRLDQS